ncbi:TIGR00266 family protein [Candidatus Sumerlaeota bacterium]|nr:TIGR00266 family protein [Candidatus Sumerlaeota bacterium]
MKRAHEIEYKIHGDDMQFAEIILDPGETVISEPGAMMFLRDGMDMETKMGMGGDEQKGLFGKLLTAGKRMVTGESLFLTHFTNKGSGKTSAGFAAPYPGKIIPINLEQYGTMLCQKDSYLCSALGVDVNIAFTKRFGAGLFGGEGFILQKLSGDGLAFIHAGGTVHHFDLGPGESMRVDTGCIVAFQESVQYDIRFIGGMKSALFGGEGLFFALLTGPGRVFLQSLPFSRLAGRIFAAAPQGGGRARGEGSILGGLGSLLDGDNSF